MTTLPPCWLHPKGQRKKGVASIATKLVSAIGFAELALTRLEIFVLPINEDSIRVTERIGAVREGIAGHRLVFGERATDAIAYSLIPGKTSDCCR